MDPLGIYSVLIENMIFWTILIYIAIYKKQTPNWIYSFLVVYILYIALRFMFSKKGMEFAVLWYTANILILLALLYTNI